MSTTGQTPAARGRPRRRAVGDDEKEARRRQILSAAKQVFAVGGYEATTMAAVARAAGVSYGAVYWYFPSKDELFHAVMAEEEQALRRHIVQALADDEPTPAEDPVWVRSLLRRAVRATFEFFDHDQAAVRLLFRDSLTMGGRFESHVLSIHERFVADVAAVLQAGRERGELRAVPTWVAAFSIAALVGQLALRRLQDPSGLDAATAAEMVVRVVVDGVTPRAPSDSVQVSDEPGPRARRAAKGR
jgi:AcrR family transcriptional regulator